MLARLSTLAISFAALGLVAGFSQSAAAAPLIKSQSPCTPAPIACVAFTDQGTIPIIRTVGLVAPSAGMAMVHFHGSATCEYSGADLGVVIFQSQIVDDPAATPDSRSPGGLHQGVRMLPKSGTSNGRAPFNLSSTRTFIIPKAGRTFFHFKIARVNMSPDTICGVHNATFSIVFIP